MTPWVATHSDLALSGLPPAACRPDARVLGGVSVATGVLQIDGHGFDGGESIRFSTGDPSPLRALPTGLAAGVWYAVAPTNSDPDFFSLSPVVIPTDAGVGPIYVSENYLPKIDREMAAWTSILVAKAVAYKAPWFTPPKWAPMMVAKRSDPSVAGVLRVPSARYPVPMVQSDYLWAMQELKFLESGGTYDDGTGPIDAASTTGINAAARATGRAPIGWGAPYRRSL